MEEEEDLDVEQEGCDIKEDDEYIERISLVDWDSPPIFDDYQIGRASCRERVC